jgi:spermidine synthase
MSPLAPACSRPASPRFLPVLLLLFVGSGCAALIYEIVWFQLLQLVIGSSGVSLGVLLGTFMGGMCLGSLALPRIISTRRHPLRVYALLELGIGIFGVLILFGMPFVSRLYMAGVGHGLAGILLRGAIAGVCLLPPTLLMGASLPAVARWVEATPKGVSWLGFFYGGNIAGAVFGCLAAGFYLLRVYDMATATFAAAALNAAVAFIGLGLAKFTPHAAAGGGPVQERAERAPGAWQVYAAIALSGLCALGAEVIWTRLLSLMLGATVYTFSIILAVVLAGLGIGSSVGSYLARGIARPRIALGWCQMFLSAAVAWSACVLAKSLPYWPINPLLSTSPWFTFQLDLVRCLWTILPAACLWGASFPLALAAAASRGQDPGRLVGGVYAANTLGAIVGALGFSVVLIPGVGTQQSQRLLIGLSFVAALVVLAPLVWPFRASASSGGAPRRPVPRMAGALSLTAAMGLAALLAWSVPRTPWGVVAYGRRVATEVSQASVLYMGEGMNASIAVTRWSDGARLFHVSGKVEASTEQQDMRLQRMLGHLPALLHPKPRSVLVVGCGAGVTAGSFVLHPGVERIVICEIEPLIPPVAARYFSHENHYVLRDRRTDVVYDDARHYILTTPEKFDIITSDPIHPWVKGTATLYSKEYFELCKRHLNPGGVITQWVPLYESDVATVRSEIATFFEVFPNGTIWSNDVDGSGYDVVLLGQVGAATINVDELQRRLDRADHLRVATSLREVGLGSALSLLATYAGQGPDLRLWLRGAQINRDRNLRLQYMAGMGLNTDVRYQIYSEMLRDRRFPDELFAGSPESKQALSTMLEAP